MAQPQQQFHMPARPYSPPQSSASPAPPNFTMPPNKRQRMSPGPPSQPDSPYVASPYGASPVVSTPQSAGASPHFSNIQLPPGAYSNSPHPPSNGHTTPTLNLPQANHNSQPYQSPFILPTASQSQISSQPNQDYMMPSRGAGAMGPPSKPAEKVKDEGIDPMDVLGGTGVDLREEEQYTFQLYSKSFNSHISGSQSGTISSGNSFTQFPPGDERSFYGAGPANATAEIPNTASQEEYHRQVIDKAWNDAARDIAISRSRELDNPFLEIAVLTQNMSRIARENGLELKRDRDGHHMGTMRLPHDFPSPSATVQTAIGPNGGITATGGNFLPYDSLLVDQVALISIATKHRLRSMIEDAARLAKGRQTTSHGIVPAEWADVAAPTKKTGGIAGEAGVRSGLESAADPRTNLLKRSQSASKIQTPISDDPKTPAPAVKFTNEVVNVLRLQAAKEREIEEQRLRKRKARQEGGAASRAGSVIPGTPGSVAPDPMEKAPTKKEQKKKAEAKVTEAVNHAAANSTTTQFLGGGGGLFGKKKKYDWLTSSASGTTTPAKLMTSGLSGTPSGQIVNAGQERLTSDGVRRLGTWREDKEKGRGIQIRDWVAVLENDGREKKALQRAYAILDDSQPK